MFSFVLCRSARCSASGRTSRRGTSTRWTCRCSCAPAAGACSVKGEVAVGSRGSLDSCQLDTGRHCCKVADSCLQGNHLCRYAPHVIATHEAQVVKWPYVVDNASYKLIMGLHSAVARTVNMQACSAIQLTYPYDIATPRQNHMILATTKRISP